MQSVKMSKWSRAIRGVDGHGKDLGPEAYTIAVIESAMIGGDFLAADHVRC